MAEIKLNIEADQIIEGFYNPRRRHSALDYESPNNFEKQQVEAA